MVTDEEKQRLQEILLTMDLPKMRLNDFNWLNRNMGIRNGSHPNFFEAQRLIAKILLWKRMNNG